MMAMSSLIARGGAIAIAFASVPRAVALAQTVAERCAAPEAHFLGAQTTFIGQDLPGFHATYSGPMSLTAHGDRQMSQSYGVYGGACVVRHLEAFVDGEM